jgi:hypothetical protein
MQPCFEAVPGQFVTFYGNRCRHYSVANLTDVTRVSFDFRVVPFELFDDNHCGPKSIRSALARGTVGKSPPPAAAAAGGSATGAATAAGAAGEASRVGGGGRPLRMGEYYVDSGAP